MFNLFGAALVVLLMIPNIVYAMKRRGETNLCKNRFMNVLEQIGRYGSMLFMVFYGEENSMRLSSAQVRLCYGLGSLFLLAAYWTVWGVYFRKMGVHIKNREPSAVFAAGGKEVSRVVSLKWALALLPAGCFALCGAALAHIPLIVSAAVFTVGHSYVTYSNIVNEILHGP